ncbi:MAG: pepsin/retropepsin-like aspartic protease family protein [Chthoniobacterales bacterium]
MKTSSTGAQARCCLPVLAIFLAALSAVGATVPRELQYQALQLERSRQNHLLVHVHINGKPALFGVDTGAPVSAVALKRRKHFGLAPLPKGSDLPAELRINGGYNRVAIAHHLRIGALTLVDEPVVMIDLSGPARAAQEYEEEELDGILGADILFPTEAVLDCGKGILFMKVDPDAKESVPGIGEGGAWTRVPIRVTRGGNLYVDCKLNSKSAQLMLDTGAFTTLIQSSFLADMHLKMRETPFTSGAVNLDDRNVQLTTIRRFAVGHLVAGQFLFGNFTVRDKEVGVMDLTGLIQGELLKGVPPVAGLLGSEFLRRNHAVIDFGNAALYLRR